ncbi:MAG: hypothetical protein ACP5N2_01155 [Candidatus Nanoarchaeia archaeon]
MKLNDVFLDTSKEKTAMMNNPDYNLETRITSPSIDERRKSFRFTKEFSFKNPEDEENVLSLFGKENFSKAKIKEKKEEYRAIVANHIQQKYNFSRSASKNLATIVINTPIYTLIQKETGPALQKEFRKEKRKVRSIYQEACQHFFVEEYNWPNPEWRAVKKHPRIVKQLNTYFNVTKIISKTVGLPKHNNHGKFSGVGAGFTIGNLPLRYVDAYAKVSNIDREDITKWSLIADGIYLGSSLTIASASYYADVNSPHWLMNAYAYVGAKNVFDILMAGNIISRVGQLIVRPYRYFHNNEHKHTPALTTVINPFLPEAIVTGTLFGFDLKMKYVEYKERKKAKVELSNKSYSNKSLSNGTPT